MSLLMVGNGVSCAIRVGEWDWAVALLDEWLAADTPASARVELLADRAILAALRGGDASPFVEAAEPLVSDFSDPQYDSYRRMAGAWIALVDGRLGESMEIARAAAASTSYFGPMGHPVAARAALWAGDRVAAIRALGDLEATPERGAALAADRLTARAGVAALEGRRAEAAGLYREALRAWRGLGLAFDEALCAIDMTTVLDPADPEVRAAAAEARATLLRLGAAPLLGRLDDAIGAVPRGGRLASSPARTAERPGERAGVAPGEEIAAG